MARKSKLTSELHQALIQTFTSGATIKDACAYVGVNESTFHKWMKQGENAVSGEYVEFFQSITRARASMRVEAVGLLRKFGREGDTDALKFLLERSDPEHWGRRTYAKIEGLDELLTLAKAKGVNASEIFAAMIAELASIDSNGS